MKNISTGTGLCVLGLCLASYPIIDRVMPRAEAGVTNVAPVVAAVTAQVPPEPTIVWYGVGSDGGYSCFTRAWSNGRLEAKWGGWTNSGSTGGCEFVTYCNEWLVVSDPAQGYTARSDINFDHKVSGADLAQVLNDWGDAPRHDVPPSTCPLNLINP